MTSRIRKAGTALLRGLLREGLPCSARRELLYHRSPQMENEFHLTACGALRGQLPRQAWRKKLWEGAL